MGVEYFASTPPRTPLPVRRSLAALAWQQRSLHPSPCLTFHLNSNLSFCHAPWTTCYFFEHTITFHTFIPVQVLFSPLHLEWLSPLFLPTWTLPFLTVTMSIQSFLILLTTYTLFPHSSLLYIPPCSFCLLPWRTPLLDFKFFWDRDGISITSSFLPCLA